MFRLRLIPSVPVPFLLVIFFLFTIAVAQAQVCHDGLWPDGEFCGYDALIVTGEAEMNHDCVLDFLDLVIFMSQYGQIGPNLSSDLDGSGTVNLIDFQNFSSSYYSGNPVSPCNPSPANPDYCDATLSLSLDPSTIVSRGRLGSFIMANLYLIADGWSNAGAIEYALAASSNVMFTGNQSPVGWTSIPGGSFGNAEYFCWEGTGFPQTGTTAVVDIQVMLTDTQPAYVELVDVISQPNLRTSWVPTTLNARSEFQVRRNVGINGPDPVSTSGCLSPNTSPTVTITDPASDIDVGYGSYLVTGSATDPDGTISLVEFRVNDGSWQAATGTGSWTASVNLVDGDNWIQARAADDVGAYSSTQVVMISRSICHDNIWPAGEFCGHDALVVTGKSEMNHDCVADFLDIVTFFSEYGMMGPNLSADLDDDGDVDLIDAQTFAANYFAGQPVSPCNPSPPNPDNCEAALSLSLDPGIIVSRGRLAGPNIVTVYLTASGLVDAGGMEYALTHTPNLAPVGTSSPVGWSNWWNITNGADYFCWNGIGFPVTGTAVVAQHDFFISDTQPATVELVDYSIPDNMLTRWTPTTIDERNEFKVRRNVGINTVDPVSTTACPSANTSPILTITDPASDIDVISDSYDVTGTANDADGSIDFVEFRINSGSWQLATGTDAWTAPASLVLGENWIQVRTADAVGAYSSTQVITIVRLDKPDLTITAWSFPDTLLAGCLTSAVSVTVLNDSTGDAPASRLGFYLSADAVIDAADFLVDTFDVPALSAGASTVINTAIMVPDEGPREDAYLGAFADDLEVVEEADETNNTVSSSLEYPIPALTSVVDVGNDQGRNVRLNVLASSRDALGSSTPILQYEAFRRLDVLPAGAARGPVPAVEGKQISDPAKLGGWEFAGAVPAHVHAEYNMIVPTLADSTDEGLHWSVFFVRAATGEPGVFFDSCPDSGYSVDNLPPSIPAGLFVAYAAAGNQLEWEPCPDEDFRYFRIYRGSSPDFVPDPENPTAAVTSTDWLDSVSDPWNHFYKITAVDQAGNESPVAVPAGVSGAENPPQRAARYALHQCVPNPFNPLTRIKYDLPSQTFVKLNVYTTDGRLVTTLVNGQVPSGTHEAVWTGKDRFGRQVAAGVYFCHMEADKFSKTIRMVLVK